MSRRKARSNSASRRPRRQVKRLVEGQVMTLDDRRIPLIYQRNTRARRIILRFDQSAGRIVVVLPPRATYDEGRRFAQTHRSWIRERVELLPEGVPFETGKVVPFLGQPRGARAVGRACATNPVAIVIPCHRACGADGSLTGYRWGQGVKQELLSREAAEKDIHRK
jgi:O-6-methylguanine DNA methyltransferase